jgi:hypothetical protein
MQSYRLFVVLLTLSHVNTHTYKDTNTHAHTHTNTHIRTHTYTQTHTLTYKHTHTHTHTHPEKLYIHDTLLLETGQQKVRTEKSPALFLISQSVKVEPDKEM